MSVTLRLLPIFAELICVFARVMAQATTYLGQKSLCACQYLCDEPIKGSLEQSALKQKEDTIHISQYGTPCAIQSTE